MNLQLGSPVAWCRVISPRLSKEDPRRPRDSGGDDDNKGWQTRSSSKSLFIIFLKSTIFLLVQMRIDCSRQIGTKHGQSTEKGIRERKRKHSSPISPQTSM